MRKTLNLMIGASFLALGACGGDGDDALADNVAEASEAKAENLQDMADNSSGAQEDALQAQAEVVEETGEAKAEAVDDADVNAQAMTPAQKEAIVNGQ